MTEEEKGKGFVIKDRRVETQEPRAPEGEQKRPEKEAAACSSPDSRQENPEGKPAAAGKGRPEEEYLEEVTFYNFILTLSSSALYHFGDFPNPETNKTECNLPAAKHAIDILTMLKNKTRGNLEEQEAKLLEGILFELQMRYVRAKAKG